MNIKLYDAESKQELKRDAVINETALRYLATALLTDFNRQRDESTAYTNSRANVSKSKERLNK